MIRAELHREAINNKIIDYDCFLQSKVDALTEQDRVRAFGQYLLPFELCPPFGEFCPVTAIAQLVLADPLASQEAQRESMAMLTLQDYRVPNPQHKILRVGCKQ